jgi:hypothetical protein
MSDITWLERKGFYPMHTSQKWLALRNDKFLGRIYGDDQGWFWFVDFRESNRLIKLTGLTTIEEAKAAATLLLSLKQS